MSYELLHFRGSDKILKEKNLDNVVRVTMEYLHDAMYGCLYKRELLRMVMDEEGWRGGEELNILTGRRYAYKGLMKRVAIDGSFSAYEYIHNALFRLQVGFDMGRIDMGIVLVTSQRSNKSPLGSTRQLILQEIELLHPTISLPVVVALFDFGKPGECIEESLKPPATDQEPVQVHKIISIPARKGTDVTDEDLHHDSTGDQNNILPSHQSSRRNYNQKRTRPAVNQ